VNAGQGQVLFLTHHPCRGPLTLNLEAPLPGARAMRVGEPVAIQGAALLFPAWGLRILTAGAATWQPPPTAASSLPLSGRRDYLARVHERRPSLDFPFDQGELERLGQAMAAGQAELAAGALSGLLGRGVGLTPQGDDLGIGLLLALNRWGALLPLGLPLEAFNRLAVESARGQTTDLSAGLLACAAEGQADERLVEALDGLLTGSPGVEACVALLQDWGSSSGWAALLGMELAISLLR
jgi:hypothetical protein